MPIFLWNTDISYHSHGTRKVGLIWASFIHSTSSVYGERDPYGGQIRLSVRRPRKRQIHISLNSILPSSRITMVFHLSARKFKHKMQYSYLQLQPQKSVVFQHLNSGTGIRQRPTCYRKSKKFHCTKLRVCLQSFIGTRYTRIFLFRNSWNYTDLKKCCLFLGELSQF